MDELTLRSGRRIKLNPQVTPEALSYIDSPEFRQASPRDAVLLFLFKQVEDPEAVRELSDEELEKILAVWLENNPWLKKAYETANIADGVLSRFHHALVTCQLIELLEKTKRSLDPIREAGRRLAELQKLTARNLQQAIQQSPALVSVRETFGRFGEDLRSSVHEQMKKTLMPPPGGATELPRVSELLVKHVASASALTELVDVQEEHRRLLTDIAHAQKQTTELLRDIVKGESITARQNQTLIWIGVITLFFAALGVLVQVWPTIRQFIMQLIMRD